MSLVLLHGLKKPIIRVGRMAGQYAKPRSADTETRDGVTLPSYRGDLVNRPAFTAPRLASRIRSCCCAATSARRSRSISSARCSTAASPTCITREYWDLGFMQHSPLKEPYQRIVDSIADSLDFFERVTGGRAPHEVTRGAISTRATKACTCSTSRRRRATSSARQRWYNLSTHMPWIGMRTAQLDGAHVEYFRGIANPIGVKVGRPWTRGLAAGPGHHAQSATTSRAG